MNETPQNTDSTSTSAVPTSPAAEAAKVAGNGHGLTVLVNYPCIAVAGEKAVIRYGDEQLIFPIGRDDKGALLTATIDKSLLRGSGTKRLQPIKTALKIAGKANDDTNRKWFNVSVRDVWHAALRFAATDALAHGKPVSLGLSLKTNKSTGEQILTSKHGFEHLVTPPRAKVVETAAAAVADKAPVAPVEPKPERVNPVKSGKPGKPGKSKRNKPAGLVAVAEAVPAGISVIPEPPVETVAPAAVAA